MAESQDPYGIPSPTEGSTADHQSNAALDGDDGPRYGGVNPFAAQTNSGPPMHRPRSIRRLMSEKSLRMDTVYSDMVMDSDVPSEPLEVLPQASLHLLTIWVVEMLSQIRTKQVASSENPMKSDKCAFISRVRALLAALSSPSQALRRLAAGCCTLLILEAFVLTVIRCVLLGPRHRGQQEVFGTQARAAIHTRGSQGLPARGQRRADRLQRCGG